MLLREGRAPWPSREMPGGVASIESDELTKGYGSVFGIGGAFRDVVFGVRALRKARSEETRRRARLC